MDMHFEGTIFQTHAAELARRLDYPFPPYRVLDVRGRAAWERGRIPGSEAAEADALAAGLPAGATPTTELFVVGSDPDDARVRSASLALRRNGALRVVELPGGMREWRSEGLAVESGPATAAA